MPPSQAAQGLADAGSGIVEEDRSEQPQGPRDPRNPQTREFEPRGAFAIINEAFAIYFARFRPLMAINIIAVLPVLVLSLALLPVDFGQASFIVVFINAVVLAFAAAATIYAVCQHYVLDRVSIGVCYARTLWRSVSITILGLILAIILTALLAVAPVAEVTPEDVTGLQISMVFALLVALVLLLVYVAMSAPAVIVEGYRLLGMVGRSFRLARRSELRILFTTILCFMVMMGMYIILMIPLLIVAFGISGGQEEMTGTGGQILVVGQILVSMLIQPIFFVAFALLYFDIRVRKEEFTLSRLRLEMGVASEEDLERIQTDETEQENTNTTRDG